MSNPEVVYRGWSLTSSLGHMGSKFWLVSIMLTVETYPMHQCQSKPIQQLLVATKIFQLSKGIWPYCPVSALLFQTSKHLTKLFDVCKKIFSKGHNERLYHIVAEYKALWNEWKVFASFVFCMKHHNMSHASVNYITTSSTSFRILNCWIPVPRFVYRDKNNPGGQSGIPLFCLPLNNHLQLWYIGGGKTRGSLKLSCYKHR